MRPKLSASLSVVVSIAIGLVLSLACLGHALAATFTLRRPVHQPLAATGYAPAIADLNGDGRADLAATNIQGHIEVFLQKADGTLDAGITLAIPGAFFQGVRGADLGGDGRIELVAGHTAGLGVYAWNGQEFVLANHPGSFLCRYVETADIDRDGLEDVFCHGYNADGMLYWGNAASGLSPPVHMHTPALGTSLGLIQPELADVTGDGLPDLLLATSNINSFFVLENDGTRGFLPAIAYTYPEDPRLWTRAIETLDLDEDGALEVVVASPVSGDLSRIHVYRRGGDGRLHVIDRMPTYNAAQGFLVEDVDRDGYQDLLVSHGGWFQVGRFMGREGDGLWPGELLSEVLNFGGSHRMAAGDLNGDGQQDVAIANSHGISLLFGGWLPRNDVWGDLVSDVIWRHVSGETRLWLNGDSSTQWDIEDAAPEWVVQATGDFDGNGASELFLRQLSNGANALGSISFHPLTTVTNQDWQVVGGGDFDGDGRADLFWRNHRSGANTVWTSADSRTTLATSRVTDLDWKVAAVGDFDGDGSSDVFWRHEASGRNAIWRSGSRATQLPVAGVADAAWRPVGTGDFNGDAKDDVVWRNARTGANTIWLSANIRTQQRITAVSDQAWKIAAVGDYDGDGRSDLFWRNTVTGANTIWRRANSGVRMKVSAAGPYWAIVP